MQDRPHPGPGGERPLSYDVRFWKIRTQVGKRKTTYAIRWTVAGREFHKSLTTKAHAESRLAELRTAARKGEAFDVETGQPVSEVQQRTDRSWYEHASLHVERRWPKVGGGQRRSIADAIATATPAMLSTDRGQPAGEFRSASRLPCWAPDGQTLAGPGIGDSSSTAHGETCGSCPSHRR